MKHKITKQQYLYECGDGCCSEWGTSWSLNGEEVYHGPQDDEGFLNVLAKLGIQAEVTDLDSDTGEEICSISNYVDLPST